MLCYLNTCLNWCAVQTNGSLWLEIGSVDERMRGSTCKVVSSSGLHYKGQSKHRHRKITDRSQTKYTARCHPSHHKQNNLFSEGHLVEAFLEFPSGNLRHPASLLCCLAQKPQCKFHRPPPRKKKKKEKNQSRRDGRFCTVLRGLHLLTTPVPGFLDPHPPPSSPLHCHP